MAYKFIGIRYKEDEHKQILVGIRRATRKRNPNYSAWVRQAIVEKLARDTQPQ